MDTFVYFNRMYLSSFQLPDFITPPSDFIGLERENAVTIQPRNLPHWRQEGASYFLTFRMEDALPRQFWDDWYRQADEARRRGESDPRGHRQTEEEQRESMKRLEDELDAGHGRCWLRDPELRRILGDILLHFQDERYRMHAFVIMPNHVHAAVQPRPGHPLSTLLKAWKSFSAHCINKAAGATGTFWHRDTFDRILRDGDHFRRVIRYIIRNPAQAGLSSREASVWVHPDVATWRNVA
jgi:REP element-mobilizing transposase RayT